MKRLMLVGLILCVLIVACSSQNSGEMRQSPAQLAAASPSSTPPVMTAPESPTIEASRPPETATPVVAITAEATSTVSAMLTELPEGWTKIDGGGEAICARGTPYSFWVRPGTINKLLIFFEGGGGCWDAESCREGSTFFDDSVDQSDSPERGTGIFDLDNPENPFKDYYMAFVPYCTGDVHMGNNVHTYTGESGEQVTIHFKGFVNGSTVLEWVYDHVGSPESVFVTGCSAGSVGSITFAPYVINHYQSSRVYQLGDSEAFVFGRPVELQSDWRSHDNFAPWIPALSQIKPGEWSAEKFYMAIANHYPAHFFSQYNTAHDSVQQRFFYAADGVGVWEDALESSLNDLQANVPNFRSYLAGGSSHCILPFDSFYSRQSNGVRFRDWVAAIAEGRAVENVRCTQCDQAE